MREQLRLVIRFLLVFGHLLYKLSSCNEGLDFFLLNNLGLQPYCCA